MQNSVQHLIEASSTADVSGKNYIDGIFGALSGRLIASECNGCIHGISYFGGLVGKISTKNDTKVKKAISECTAYKSCVLNEINVKVGNSGNYFRGWVAGDNSTNCHIDATIL